MSIYTVNEVAQTLGVHPVTLRRMIAAKTIPHHRIRRRVVFTESDILSFLDNAAVPAHQGAVTQGAENE